MAIRQVSTLSRPVRFRTEMWACDADSKVFYASGLSDGPHTVIMTNADGGKTKSLAFDYVVYNSSTYSPGSSAVYVGSHPTPTSASSDTGTSKGIKSTAIGAGVGGGIALLGLLALVVWFCIRRRRRDTRPREIDLTGDEIKPYDAPGTGQRDLISLSPLPTRSAVSDDADDVSAFFLPPHMPGTHNQRSTHAGSSFTADSSGQTPSSYGQSNDMSHEYENPFATASTVSGEEYSRVPTGIIQHDTSTSTTASTSPCAIHTSSPSSRPSMPATPSLRAPKTDRPLLPSPAKSGIPVSAHAPRRGKQTAPILADRLMIVGREQDMGPLMGSDGDESGILPPDYSQATQPSLRGTADGV
jgi:hypothetical protein